jgi:hypothetical protein
MAYNIAYPTMVAEPVAKYVKTIPVQLTGFRFDPKGENRAEFCLTGNDPVEDYDSSVLEIYSEREDQFLRRANRVLFAEGLLKPYEGKPAEVNTANFLSDLEIERIASIRRINDLEAAIAPITSSATLGRIMLLAEERGMAKRMRDVIEAKMVAVR